MEAPRDSPHSLLLTWPGHRILLCACVSVSVSVSECVCVCVCVRVCVCVAMKCLRSKIKNKNKSSTILLLVPHRMRGAKEEGVQGKEQAGVSVLVIEGVRV